MDGRSRQRRHGRADGTDRGASGHGGRRRQEQRCPGRQLVHVSGARSVLLVSGRGEDEGLGRSGGRHGARQRGGQKTRRVAVWLRGEQLRTIGRHGRDGHTNTGRRRLSAHRQSQDGSRKQVRTEATRTDVCPLVHALIGDAYNMAPVISVPGGDGTSEPRTSWCPRPLFGTVPSYLSHSQTAQRLSNNQTKPQFSRSIQHDTAIAITAQLGWE